MTPKTFKELNEDLREALQHTLEALQTEDKTFARFALSSCQKALLAAKETNPRLETMTKCFVKEIERNLRHLL